MSITTLRAVATQDTKEVITHGQILGNYREGDGYDWKEEIETEGWAVIPNWGIDGWDLGQWPYVMVAGTRTADENGPLWGMATYCEGDVATTWYRDQKAHWAAVTAEAHFSWVNGQAHGPKDLPEKLEDIPAQYAQPYPGWIA